MSCDRLSCSPSRWSLSRSRAEHFARGWRPDVLDQARTLLTKGEYQQAAAIIEDALPTSAPGDRGAMIDLLRQTYRNLISQAEAAGKSREADEYRDNLAIIDHAGDTPRTFHPSPGRPRHRLSPRPFRLSLRRARGSAGSGCLRDHGGCASGRRGRRESRPSPLAPRVLDAGSSGPGRTVLPAGSRAHARARRPCSGKTSDHCSATEARGEDGGASPAAIEQAPGADRSGRAAWIGRTAQARSGTALVLARRVRAESGRSPVHGEEVQGSRADLCAPGRLEPVARSSGSRSGPTADGWPWWRGSTPRPARIGNGMRSSKRSAAFSGWSRGTGTVSISRTGSRRPGGPRDVPGGSWSGGRLRMRTRPGSSPGCLVGPAPRRSRPRQRHPRLAASRRWACRPWRTRGDCRGSRPEKPRSRRRPCETRRPRRRLSWHVHESANFRVYHVDAAVAAQASQAAEAVRSKQAKRWGSTATRSTWSPKCEIYLYPTPRDFAQMTGQPETSPGFSTMGINGNRIIARRVNLRADHPQLLTAILPHEVTHVVLADLFTEKQIPRWADEGMAVLAEPISEQVSRAGDLAAPLEQGRLFRLSELMAIDYPNAESWGLYYAQSVSLTQFLVELGTPEQFVSFVRAPSARASSRRCAMSIASRVSRTWRRAGRTTPAARSPRSPPPRKARPARPIDPGGNSPPGHGRETASTCWFIKHRTASSIDAGLALKRASTRSSAPGSN